MPKREPVELKVASATKIGGLWGLASVVAIWAAQTYLFAGDLPLGTEAIITGVVTTVGAFIGGYHAPHTHRSRGPR